MKRTLMSSKQVSRNKPKKALNRQLRQCEHTWIQTQWERKRVFIVPLWHLNKCAHFLHVYWTYLCTCVSVRVCVCVSGRSLWRPTCATCSQTPWGSSTLPSPLVSWRCVVARSCLCSSPPSWWPWWSAIITTTGRRWRRSVFGLIICTCIVQSHCWIKILNPLQHKCLQTTSLYVKDLFRCCIFKKNKQT